MRVVLATPLAVAKTTLLASASELSNPRTPAVGRVAEWVFSVRFSTMAAVSSPSLPAQKFSIVVELSVELLAFVVAFFWQQICSPFDPATLLSTWSYIFYSARLNRCFVLVSCLPAVVFIAHIH